MDAMLVSQEPEISDQASLVAPQSLRIPRVDRAFLTRPSLRDAQRLVERLDAFATRLKRALPRQRLHEQNLVAQPGHIVTAALRLVVRRDCLRAAQEFTRSISADPNSVLDISDLEERSLIATGHQPELFHAGVWVKNVAVSELAGRTNSIGLNLIVDNDLVHERSIRLPKHSATGFKTQEVSFDDLTTERPWEEASVQNEPRFAEFSESVGNALEAWGLDSVLTDHWSAAMQVDRNRSLAEKLSAVRRSIECELEVNNLELPMSIVCQTDGFLTFAATLFLNIKSFVESHNSALGSFRQVNQIRSQTHPVPELISEANVFEAPFWVWTSAAKKRRAVFVHIETDEIALSSSTNQADEFARFSRHSSDQAVDALRSLNEAGVKIRTRALTTTMFVRLFLSDLFVHGIGGAKYDEMTDDIIRDFFGIEPPDFLTISYTAWLPFAKPSSDRPQDIHSLKQRIRDLQQNPQRYLLEETDAEVVQLIAEKERLIKQQQASMRGASTAEQKQLGRKRYRRFPEINRQLAQQTAPLIEDAQAELRRVETNLAADQVITNREFSIAAFSKSRLREIVAEVQQLFCD
jgi:hypothetical protein